MAEEDVLDATKTAGGMMREEERLDLQRRAEQERLLVAAAVKIQAVRRGIFARGEVVKLRVPYWIQRGTDWIQSHRERLGPVTRRAGGTGRRVSFALDPVEVVGVPRPPVVFPLPQWGVSVPAAHLEEYARWYVWGSGD